MDVADGSNEPGGDRDVHPGDGQQPVDAGIIENGRTHLAVDDR